MSRPQYQWNTATAGPSSQSASSASAPVTDAQKKGHKNKLTDAGRKILQDYVASHGNLKRELTLSERRELVARIQRQPGCDYYQMQLLTAWLSRQSAHKTEHQDFPTLNDAVRTQLSGLLELELSDPSPAKVALWARMVQPTGATPSDVHAYVQHLRERALATRLPTPATTATPEPASPPTMATPAPTTPVRSPPAPAPVVSPPVRARYVHSSKEGGLALPGRKVTAGAPLLLPGRAQAAPASYPSPPLLNTNIPPGASRGAEKTRVASSSVSQSPPAPAPAPVRRPTMPELIRQGVLEHMANPDPIPEVLPRTPQEFSAMWAAYDPTLADLARKLQV